VYVDADPSRRAIATSYGAQTVDHLPEALDRRFPIVVEALGEPAALELAMRSLGRDGICTSTAVYFGGDVEVRMPLLSMYMMVGSFTTGRLHARRDGPQVLNLLASGSFDPNLVATRVVSFDDAADALTSHDYTKLIFTP
jgi:alcohol dehydrogenase